MTTVLVVDEVLQIARDWQSGDTSTERIVNALGEVPEQALTLIADLLATGDHFKLGGEWTRADLAAHVGEDHLTGNCEPLAEEVSRAAYGEARYIAGRLVTPR